MSTWLTYAIFSALFAGLYSFLSKVSAHLNHNASLVTAWSMLIASCLSFLTLLYNNHFDFSSLPSLLLLSFINGLIYFTVVLTRIESLKYIHTTLYFPMYKTISPIIVTSISLFYFSESLNISDAVGITLGIIIPLLLINKSEIDRQVNMKKGVLLLAVGAVGSSLSSCIPKLVLTANLNLDFLISASQLFGSLISFGIYFRFPPKKPCGDAHLKLFAILGGISLYLSWYLYSYASAGNLAIAFTINSFSVVVTIFLAVSIFKEHMNIQKLLAIVLSLLAIMVFI